MVFLNDYSLLFKADFSAGMKKIFGKQIKDEATIQKCKFVFILFIKVQK
jgi:hypothetical protein